MKRRLQLFQRVWTLTACLLLAVGCAPEPSSSGGRKILYYVDPMNPAHTSPDPGLAPCGMKMEPVYEGGVAGESPATKGAVRVSPDKKALMGVRTVVAQKQEVRKLVRWPAKVAAQQHRIFQINAPLDGRITAAPPGEPGSRVAQDQILAAYYSPEFLHPAQILVFAWTSEENFRSNRNTAAEISSPRARSAFTDKMPQFTLEDQMSGFKTNRVTQTQLTLQLNIDALRNFGMAQAQLEELFQNRRSLDRIDLRSPVAGVLLARNAALGQLVQKGAELFRVADVSTVLAVASGYAGDVTALKPGMAATFHLPHGQRSFPATVSAVLPKFDDMTRALEVRFEIENPDMTLLPGHFGDVEVEVTAADILAIPLDAVVDTGQKKLVYVEASPGVFQPRAVTLGDAWGNQVAVLSGVSAGEKVAAAGNFLIDSESRIQLNSVAEAATAIDVVCKMTVEEAEARTEHLTFDYQGQTYFFCGDSCQKSFAATPQHYLPPAAVSKDALAPVQSPTSTPAATHH